MEWKPTGQKNQIFDKFRPDLAQVTFFKKNMKKLGSHRSQIFNTGVFCKLSNLSDSVMGNNVENTPFLSYVTFKIFLFNVQKDFHLVATANSF